MTVVELEILEVVQGGRWSQPSRIAMGLSLL
jgi:hypothetical protein